MKEEINNIQSIESQEKSSSSNHARERVAWTKKKTISISSGDAYKLLDKKCTPVVGEDLIGRKTFDVQFPQISARKPEEKHQARKAAERIWGKYLKNAVSSGILTSEQANKISLEVFPTLRFQGKKGVLLKTPKIGKDNPEKPGKKDQLSPSRQRAQLTPSAKVAKAPKTSQRKARLLVVGSTVMLASSACVVPSIFKSAVSKNIKPAAEQIPEITKTPFSPVETYAPGQSPGEVLEVAMPLKTPTPETTPFPLPEGQINPNFSIGPISLERPFKLVVPLETSKLAGYGSYLSYDVDPLTNFEKTWPPYLVRVFNDYANHPTAAFVVRSDLPLHNIIYGHSFSNFGKPLLLDWTRRVYESPDRLIGKSVFVEQFISGNTVKVRLEFVNAIHIDDRLFNEADGYYENINEPMFIRTDVLGLPDNARKEQQISFVTCLETLPGQKRDSSRRFTDNRVVLTAELREVIEE
jgi:hypothetical protein